MNKRIKTALTVCAILVSNNIYAGTVTLTGNSLSIDDVVAIAKNQQDVTVTKAAQKKVEQGYDVLIASAKQGMGVYGLTVGVGWNKDKPVFGSNGKMSEELISLSNKFNRDLVYSHSAAYGEFMSNDLVRMSMAIRLNQLLTGHVGVQPVVAEMYQQFLNADIVPLVPQGGSVGTADILPGAHIALAFMGQWDVMYKGKRMSGKEAMDKEGIKPLSPFAKDALSIFSHNALAIAYAVDIAYKTQQILDVSPKVLSMSLEALNGNVSPYLQQTVAQRNMPHVADISKQITDQLDGSYLWQTDDKRALQDPLAFRGSQWALASLQDEVNDLKELVTLHLNSSDDNPSIVIGEGKNQHDMDKPQVENYLVKGDVKGAVYSSSNFEPVQIAVKMQSVGIALAHVNRDAVFRTLKLADPNFTHLTRFMNAPDNQGHGFGAIQKTPVSLYTEIKSLVNPVSLDGMAVAGYIEDTFTNLMLIGQRMEKVVENTQYILGVEMMHSAQGIDIRMQQEDREIGAGTKTFHDEFRKHVKFVSEDRPFTGDIFNSKQFISQQ